MNMRKNLFLISALVLLLFSPLVSAQDKDEKRYYYVGSIGGDLPIQMELSLQGTELRGSYYYDNRGIPITLLGEANLEESKIELSEFGDKKKKTGKFAGMFAPVPDGLGTTIEGTWSSPDGNTRLPFKLTKVANYDFSTIKQGKYSEAKWSYPLLISDNEVIQKVSIKLRDLMKPQIEEYQKDAKEGFMTDAITNTWLFSYDYSLAYYSEELISFIGQVYSYTGGAHGNTYFMSSNYSIGKDDSTLLKLSDLFKKESNYVKILSDLIIKDLKKQKAGWVVNGEITSLKEDEIGPFALTPRGIKFAFAPYAVGPYSDGAFFVIVSYQDLKEVIDLKGPLSWFFESDEDPKEEK